MKDIWPSTENEDRLFKAIQKRFGAFENGVIGCQTMSDIAIGSGVKDGFPYTLQIYGHPVIIGNDLIAWSPKTSLKNFENSMLGSFTNPRADTPCSFLINGGETIYGASCHAHIGKPESVLYRMKDGSFGIQRAMYRGDLPDDIRWAVGGMGLLDMYSPAAEGFTGKYADVTYENDHNVLAVKNGKVYGILYKSMTADQINAHCRDRMQFDMAILLDGGGLAAMNGTEKFAQYNTKIKQGYAIQFI